MKKTIGTLMGIMAMVALLVPANGYAQSAELVALQNQVKELTRKVAAMEGRGVSNQSSFGGGYVMPTEGDVKSGGLIHTMQDIDMGGHIETRYTAHIDQQGGATGRIFDAGEGFSLNQAKLYFEKVAEEDGGAGFRLDILAGNDASVVDFDPSTDGDDFAFQQAYVEVNHEILGKMVNIKAGRFATLAGMEVIEPADNWNISRSFAFGFSLPFTHTGVRTNFDLAGLDVYLGLNNGWDNDIDNNDFRTMEFAVGYDISESLSYFSAIYFGAENAGRNDDHRFLWTHVLAWDISDVLSMAFNFDWGRENDALVPGDTGNAEWAGFSAYTRYQISDLWAAAYRFEVFRDTDRFRGVSGTNDTFLGNTLTVEYTPYENLIARAEYRLDTANSGNGAVFGGDSSRSTLSAQLIYLI